MQYALVLAGVYVLATNAWAEDDPEPAPEPIDTSKPFYATPDTPKICYQLTDSAIAEITDTKVQDQVRYQKNMYQQTTLLLQPDGRLCSIKGTEAEISQTCGGALSPQPPDADLAARLTQQKGVSYCGHNL